MIHHAIDSSRIRSSNPLPKGYSDRSLVVRGCPGDPALIHLSRLYPAGGGSHQILGEAEGSSPRVEETWTVLWWYRPSVSSPSQSPDIASGCLLGSSLGPGLMCWTRWTSTDSTSYRSFVHGPRVSVSLPVANVPPSSLHTGPR